MQGRKGQWVAIKDGDERAARLYRRHYSCYHYRDGRRDNPRYRNRNQIIGPGEKLLLITSDGRAIFAWRKFIDKSGQKGVNCAVFRNETGILSSTLVLEAERYAWRRWPGERLYTYVDAKKIRSTNPGYCFLRAGWRRLKVRTKKRGLMILEKLPDADQAEE